MTCVLLPFLLFSGTACQRKHSYFLGGHSQKPAFHVFLVAWIPQVLALLFSHSFAFQQSFQKSGSTLQNGQHCPHSLCFSLPPSWLVLEWLAIFVGLWFVVFLPSFQDSIPFPRLILSCKRKGSIFIKKVLHEEHRIWHQKDLGKNPDLARYLSSLTQFPYYNTRSIMLTSYSCRKDKNEVCSHSTCPITGL